LYYSSPNFIRMIKSRTATSEGQAGRKGNMRNSYKISVAKLQWKRTLGKPTYSWKDIIKTDLRKTGCGSADWIKLFQGRIK